MLSDAQVDELERLIVFSTMDTLPLVLSRAVPLLFSELRLVRATLDSKVGDFLGGITNADDQRTVVATGAGEAGLRERHEPVAVRPQVQGHGNPPADQGLAGGEHQGQGDTGQPKRRRGRPKKGSGPSQLDTGAGQPQVGGPVTPEVGVDSVLGIEANPRLKGSN
jgi:hypothetical protein